MIAVIADDLSGAAEIAGLALRYQLSVEMTTFVKSQTDADVLVVSTDSRSMNEEDAVAVTKRTITAILKLNPTLIYKKVDSVLRGHILAEIEVQLKEMKLDKAILIPTNPSLGRTIVEGQYYVQGKLIHETAFAKDPEFGVVDACVIRMVRGDKDRVSVIKNEQSLSSDGIFIGEVSCKDDVKVWAASAVNREILLAGAGDFFIELIEANAIGIKSSEISFKVIQNEFPYLMVSGTSFTQNSEAIRKVKLDGGPVSYMPDSVYSSNEIMDDEIERWSDEIVSLIQKQGSAIIAIDNRIKASAEALYLRSATAACVKKVMDKIHIKELYVEGGSTAAAIIDQLGITNYFPETELARGVVRMRVKYNQSFYITIKPGSYPHPAGVFSFAKSDINTAI